MKTPRKPLYTFLLIHLFLLSACVQFEKEESERPAERESQKTESTGLFSELRNALDEAENVVNEAQQSISRESGNETGASEVLHHSELSKTLPEKLQRMNRTDKEAQTTNIVGIKTSYSKATYTKDDQQLTIIITDTGGIGAALAEMAVWSQFEVDKETNDGYERSGNWNGYKSLESYNSKYNKAELSLLVQERLIVNAIAKNMTMDQLKKVVQNLDLEDLLK